MTKTLLLLVVPVLVLPSCSSGSSGTGSATTSGPAAAQTAEVDMRNDLRFHPSTVRARVGTVTLDVVNAGTVPHDLTFRDRSLGTTGNVDGGTSRSLRVTFAEPGTFTFTCTVHPGMDGEVVVS